MAKYAPGAIVCATWGYEQTNATFARIESMTPSSVMLQPLKTVNTWQGDTMRGTAVPGEPEGQPVRRVIRGGSVRINDAAKYATPWDGQPVRVTSYA